MVCPPYAEHVVQSTTKRKMKRNEQKEWSSRGSIPGPRALTEPHAKRALLSDLFRGDNH